MARILTALATLRRDTPHHLPTAADIDQICRQHGHDFRERFFTPLVTLQFFCLQILHGNTAIAHLRQLTGIDFAVSSYSEARTRLPLDIFESILEWMARSFNTTIVDPSLNLLANPRLIIVDAFTFSMPDTDDLRECFGLPPGQKVGIGYPAGKVMALLDDATGMFIRLLHIPLFTHDMRGAIGLHSDFKTGDILLGDTAFCSFAHMCLLKARGVHGVFRLHQRRPKTAGLQRWQRPVKPPTWMSVEQYAMLPQFIDIRVVKHTITEKGFRTKVVFIAATLQDQQAWSDQKIRELYGKRWDIEVCFDHLKTTMKMNVLKCQTADGVRKELAVYLMVYNRARLAMLGAAVKQRVEHRRISLIDAVRFLSARMMGLPGVEKLIANPLRPGRSQPRVQRRRPKSYPWMTKPRNVLKMALFAG
jgi:hypothetical protein